MTEFEKSLERLLVLVIVGNYGVEESKTLIPSWSKTLIDKARKQIASEIVQPYADKGFKCYEESVEAAKEDDSERSNEFYWDGFFDCATRILEELKAINKGE